MKSNSFLKSSMLVLLITLLIKVAAFVKQMVIGAYLGADSSTDAYFITYEFAVSVVFVAFSSISVSFIPVYQHCAAKDDDKANRFATSVVFCCAVVGLILALAVFFTSGQLAAVLVGGNKEIPLDLMAGTIRKMSLAIFFGGVITALGALLEANLIFTYSKIFGLVLSAIVIPMVVFGSSSFGVDCLIWATVIAYAVHFAITIFGVARTPYRVRIGFERNELKLLCLAVLPLMLGNGVYQIGNMIDKVIAANVGTGVPSSLAYAQTISDSVCALTITSVVSVLFAYASKMIALDKQAQLTQLIDSNIKVLLAASAPFCVILFFGSTAVVQVIYGRGSFGDNAVAWTSLALKGVSLGMPFLVLREVFSRVHYSYGDTKTPLINGAIAILVHVPLSFLLSRFFGILGITLGASVSYCVCGVAIYTSAKKYTAFRIASCNRFFCRLLGCTVFSGIVSLCVVLLGFSSLVELALITLETLLVFVFVLRWDLLSALRTQKQLKMEE